MSEYMLTVGECFDKRRSERCISYLREAGINPDASLFQSQDRQSVQRILLLNLATVGVFLDYVASLATKSSKALMNDPAFMNLPYWGESLWMPVDFARPKVFEDDQDGSFFFGGSPRLLATLEGIKSISRIPLGSVPPVYDLMMKDMRSFYKSSEGVEGDEACIQWVWRGLHDGASLALRKNLPMSGNGL